MKRLLSIVSMCSAFAFGNAHADTVLEDSPLTDFEYAQTNQEGIQAQVMICGLDLNIPAGYVPIAYVYSSPCGGFGTNATIYDLPYSGQTICGIRVTSRPPLPSNFVPIAYTYHNNCRVTGSITVGSNATIIQTPFPAQLICGLTPPPGYYAARTTYSNSCRADSLRDNPNAIVIEALLQPPPPEMPLPKYPDDWVRTIRPHERTGPIAN